MSDTPKSDDAAKGMEGYAGKWVPHYIAQELEREACNKYKTYKTRVGGEVRVYETQGEGKRPIHGVYYSKAHKEFLSGMWTAKGRVYTNDSESWDDIIDL